MISSYKQFINEGLTDLMIPKSKNDIDNFLNDIKNNEKELNRAYSKLFSYLKEELQDKFDDIIFKKESTVYTDRIYIKDKYDDEDNLRKIKNIIDNYGIECTFSTHEGHSAIKITIKNI
jgi:hypothetical protein